MAWPTPQDYNEAVQNPQICFSDPELRQGTLALNPLGLPKVISGAFASVYRLDCPSGTWAVRCFLRDYPDHERRYSAISQHLQAARLPCMVGFEFLTEGIRVAGRWYPILKMEWIDGEPINDYIGRNLRQPVSLQSLAERWLALIDSMRDAGIAHGDLQHGNVVISKGRIRLIDYDCMYVPALAGHTSHEVGHRNYQHPARSCRDYGADLDNFSAWVIFASISAVAISPRLWTLLNAGDECLLFRREDFERPVDSKALRAFEAAEDQRLRVIAAEKRGIFGSPLSLTPPLNRSSLKNLPGLSTSITSARGAGHDRLPSWLIDHLEPHRPSQSSDVERPSDKTATNSRANQEVLVETASQTEVAVSLEKNGYCIIVDRYYVSKWFVKEFCYTTILIEGTPYTVDVRSDFWKSPHKLGGFHIDLWITKRFLRSGKPSQSLTFILDRIGSNLFSLSK